MNKNIFDLEFLKKYFKIKHNRGYYFRTQNYGIIHRPRGLLHNKLFQAHVEGKICLYFTPQRNALTTWGCLDFDVLDKGQILTIAAMTTKYINDLRVVKWFIDEVGLKPENYLFILSGRGIHLFLFFEQFIPGNYAYHLINTLKELIINHYDDISWHPYPYIGIDLRPSNIDDEKKCIQLPGYNFTAKRFSIPFQINNDGSIELLENTPNIEPISFNAVTYMCSEFEK